MINFFSLKETLSATLDGSKGQQWERELFISMFSAQEHTDLGVVEVQFKQWL